MKKFGSSASHLSLQTISHDSLNLPINQSIVSPSTPIPGISAHTITTTISVQPTKKSQLLIINKFQSIIIEYFHSFQQSNLESSLELPPQQIHKIVLDGYIAIIHIFKITLQLTKNVDSAESYSQKGISYYLEYIDQMNKLGLIQTNYLDAFYISYNKTIGDIYTGTRNTSYTPINTLVSSDVEDCSILKQLSQLATILVWHTNPNLKIQQYMEIAFYYFKKYCAVCSITNAKYPQMPDICMYLDTVQKIMPEMETQMYFDFLEDLHKILNRSHKKEAMTQQYFNDKCLFLSIYYKQLEPEDLTAANLAKFLVN